MSSEGNIFPQIIMHLDLSSLSSVRKFASDFTSKYGGPSSPGLSMLINNAGVANAVGIRSLTKDGFEEAFGVNHLAHFLLTNLLLPEIERAGALSTADNPARVIIVSSGVHVWGKLNFDDLMYEKTPLNEYLFPSKLYCNSKLANALFNVELARRLRAKKVKVTSNALDPGLVGTNFGKDHPRKFFVRNVIFPILSFFQMKSAREVRFSKFIYLQNTLFFGRGGGADINETIRAVLGPAKYLTTWTKL